MIISDAILKAPIPMLMLMMPKKCELNCMIMFQVAAGVEH